MPSDGGGGGEAEGVDLCSACSRGREVETPVSQGTLALTKDGSQKKVKDTGELAKLVHYRRDWI